MSERFTEEFRQALSNWITHMAAWMEIRDWEIVLHDSPPDNAEAAAMMDCTYGKKRGNLHLAHDFFSYQEKDQEHYLIHELCHIVHDNVDKVLEDKSLSTVLGIPAYTMVYAHYCLQMETFTDTFAIIVRLLMADGEIYKDLLRKVFEAEHDQRSAPVTERTGNA